VLLAFRVLLVSRVPLGLLSSLIVLRGAARHTSCMVRLLQSLQQRRLVTAATMSYGT
jgi:hypothetical protein